MLRRSSQTLTGYEVTKPNSMAICIMNRKTGVVFGSS
jgi:hypothetical protein